MAVQLVVGVMNLAAMAALAAWIALEKLTPFGPRLARVGGAAAILAGVALLAEQAGWLAFAP
jgi:predicted metal-binding membrane protein